MPVAFEPSHPRTITRPGSSRLRSATARFRRHSILRMRFVKPLRDECGEVGIAVVAEIELERSLSIAALNRHHAPFSANRESLRPWRRRKSLRRDEHYAFIGQKEFAGRVVVATFVITHARRREITCFRSCDVLISVDRRQRATLRFERCAEFK